MRKLLHRERVQDRLQGAPALLLAEENVTPLLLARGANVNAKNAQGDTALRYASNEDKPEKVRWLLKSGADCTPAHNHGLNLICWSADRGLSDLVCAALAHGLEVNTRNRFQRTPLMFAAANGDAETVRLLLAHGANVNAQDKAGMTALMYAAQENGSAQNKRPLDAKADMEVRVRRMLAFFCRVGD